MYKRILTLSVATVMLASCGEHAEKVEALKRGDKNLSCSEVQLEINEADQYKKMAYDKQRLGIKSIVMPLGYIDTYMSADDAVKAADARIAYLNRIYDIKKCDPVSSEYKELDEGDLNENIQRAMQMQPPAGQPPVTYGYPAYGGQQPYPYQPGRY